METKLTVLLLPCPECNKEAVEINMKTLLPEQEDTLALIEESMKESKAVCENGHSWNVYRGYSSF